MFRKQRDILQHPRKKNFTASLSAYLSAGEHIPETVGGQDKKFEIFLYQEILEIRLGDDLQGRGILAEVLSEGHSLEPNLLVVCPNSSVAVFIK